MTPATEESVWAHGDGETDALAAVAHESWSGWMRYLFEKSEKNPDGTVTIPVWAVERWERQMNTPYNELSEEEKKSDREEAGKYLAAVFPCPLCGL